ncbi:hypothetical protein ACFE04_027750 [Oxalis oulophora]
MSVPSPSPRHIGSSSLSSPSLSNAVVPEEEEEEEAQRSAEQKAKKAMQKYASITGRGGMTGAFDKLGEPIDVRLIPVFKKILKAEQAAGIVLGDQEDIGGCIALPTDILSKACGFFNLLGYLVGAGLNATTGMLFPPKKLGAQNAEIIRLRNFVKQLESQSEDLDAHNSLAVKERELFESNQRIQILTRELEILKGITQPYISQFDEDPKGTPDYGGSKSKQSINIDKLCRLSGLLDGKLTKVAKAKIVADGAFSPAMVHFRKLNQNEYKVVVMVDVEPDYEVPIPTDEIKTVGQTCDGFLAWSKDLCHSTLT